jgi:hypothetical protein
MTRLYHPWHLWEDYQHNFYGGASEYQREDTHALYASLLKEIPRFEQALTTIINEWKYSCEHNLTHSGMNRVAYLGQASCALVYKVPHSVCMGGYNLLTDEEKRDADATAQKYLDLWLSRHPQEDT